MAWAWAVGNALPNASWKAAVSSALMLGTDPVWPRGTGVARSRGTTTG